MDHVFRFVLRACELESKWDQTMQLNLVCFSQVCRLAWMRIHAVSNDRLKSIRSEVLDDTVHASGRRPRRARFNRKYEQVRAFFENYFHEDNGRCEKLPNPRFGHDEWRLPVWLKPTKVYKVYCDDCKNCSGTCLELPSALRPHCSHAAIVTKSFMRPF